MGYLLASVIIVEGTTLLLALVMMIIFMVISGANVSIVEIIVFPLFSILYIISLIVILKNIEKLSQPEHKNGKFLAYTGE